MTSNVAAQGRVQEALMITFSLFHDHKEAEKDEKRFYFTRFITRFPNPSLTSP